MDYYYWYVRVLSVNSFKGSFIQQIFPAWKIHLQTSTESTICTFRVLDSFFLMEWIPISAASASAWFLLGFHVKRRHFLLLHCGFKIHNGKNPCQCSLCELERGYCGCQSFFWHGIDMDPAFNFSSKTVMWAYPNCSQMHIPNPHWLHFVTAGCYKLLGFNLLRVRIQFAALSGYLDTRLKAE